VLGIITKPYLLGLQCSLKVGAGSDLPAVNTRAEYQLLGLAGGGVYPADTVTSTAVRSYRTISPLPVPRQVETIGCVFSVALSRGSPGPQMPNIAFGNPSRVAVSHHRALSCSDFPPRTYFMILGGISWLSILQHIELVFSNVASKSQNRCGATARPTLLIYYYFVINYKLL